MPEAEVQGGRCHLGYLTRRVSDRKRGYGNEQTLGALSATRKLTYRCFVNSINVIRLLEKRRLNRFMIGIAKVAHPNTNEAKTLLWTQVYALA